MTFILSTHIVEIPGRAGAPLPCGDGFGRIGYVKGLSLSLALSLAGTFCVDCSDMHTLVV